MLTLSEGNIDIQIVCKRLEPPRTSHIIIYSHVLHILYIYKYKYDLQMHCCITAMVSLIESLPMPPMVAQSLCSLGPWRMGRLALA